MNISGGDGTLNEVANGILGVPHAAMTCVPTGTGNDFLKNFGAEMLPRFVSEWIPMEELYFKTFQIKEKCSICLTV